MRYAYTSSGQVRSITYPDNAIVDYVRNTLDQVTEVGVKPAGGVRTVLLNNAAYEPFGPATGWTYGNGRSLARTYDQDYRAKTILDSAAGGLSLAYGYNEVGELTELKDGLQSAALAQYDYDTLGRLKVTRDGPTSTPLETYGYDATGNRNSLLHGGITTSYTYPGTSHRLSNVGGISRGYDPVGNTTSIGGTAREFVYNANDRMSQVKQASVVKASYRYNARGERVSRADNATGAITGYTLYDEAGHWLGDYDANGATKQQAIWLGDAPVGLVVGAGVAQTLRYVQPDHLGTPRAVVDPSRNLAIWTWDAKGEAFGNNPPNQDPDQDGTAFVFDMRFPGQRFDAATGLNYNYFRDYDAATGRYVQSDPIGLDGGAGTYVYANANSLAAVDLFGLAPGDCYKTMDLAAANAIADINPLSIKEDREYAGWVYKRESGLFSYTKPRQGERHSAIPGDRPYRAMGVYHTHGAESGPEYADESLIKEDIEGIYPDFAWVGTPTSRIIKYSSTGTANPWSLLPKPGANNSDACGCDQSGLFDAVKRFFINGW